MRESRELSPNPPTPIQPNPTFHAAPLSDNLHEWHFTLLGPPSTPYAGGIYHGRIVLPPTYPLRPPSFRFLTPSGRFEVNREICLSISGFHEESWQPAWGVRLALTALRVFMVEDGKGQVGGLEASETVRKQLAERSRTWKCSGCETGGKTNEEVMKEWWDCCRERGVEVAPDGEVVEGPSGEAEKVPEELRVGYRDELGAKENSSQQNQSQSSKEAESTSRTAHSSTLTPEEEEEEILALTKAIMALPNITTSRAPESGPSEVATNSSNVVTATDQTSSTDPKVTSPTATQQATSSQLQTSSSRTNPSSSPISHSTNSPAPSRSLAQQQRRVQQQQQIQPPAQVSTPWLDRAISGVVIALLFMVLKKIIHV